jgi:hypothetical protein
MDKYLFDMEYSTQIKREVEFLKSKGILYTFVKKKNGISTYKYTKTPKLFLALVSFYIENN